MKFTSYKNLIVVFSDLERALKRLAHRRSAENRISEERRRRASQYKNKLHSEMVAAEDQVAYHSGSPAENLKIIKPLEGSPIMHQWRYMAQVDLDTAVSQALICMHSL